MPDIQESPNALSWFYLSLVHVVKELQSSRVQCGRNLGSCMTDGLTQNNLQLKRKQLLFRSSILYGCYKMDIKGIQIYFNYRIIS